MNDDQKKSPHLEIRFTNAFEEAQDLRDQGFEPIECAFGQFGSVLGKYEMDHHGDERLREGVALRACRDLYGVLSHDPRFVVTGTPDADAVLAMIALSAAVPRQSISQQFYELVNAYDLDPIGIDLFTTPSGIDLAYFNQIQGLSQSESGFRRAIHEMILILTGKVSEDARAKVVRADEARKRTALRGILGLHGIDGWPQTVPQSLGDMPVLRGELTVSEHIRVAVVKSAVWGFDQWYRVAPVVVSYASRMGKVTVGCPDRQTAEYLFGKEGLMTVWPRLGKGWGGREAIGGSPRGTPLELSDAHRTAAILTALLAERHA